MTTLPSSLSVTDVISHTKVLNKRDSPQRLGEAQAPVRHGGQDLQAPAQPARSPAQTALVESNQDGWEREEPVGSLSLFSLPAVSFVNTLFEIVFCLFYPLTRKHLL